MIITGASVSARARKRSRCRVDSSAQWMSSMITTSGPSSVARSHSMVIASNNCSRIDSDPSGASAEVRQQRPECGPARAGPFQHLVAPVLGEQVAEGTDHRRVRQPVTAQRHALAADQLGLAVGQGPNQVGDERLDHGGLAGARRRHRR